jgi:hypothetical protein
MLMEAVTWVFVPIQPPPALLASLTSQDEGLLPVVKVKVALSEIEAVLPFESDDAPEPEIVTVPLQLWTANQSAHVMGGSWPLPLPARSKVIPVAIKITITNRM